MADHRPGARPRSGWMPDRPADGPRRAAQGITTHWLRHTTLTWVERHAGYAVARAYAGPEGGLNGAGVTATYVRADLHEVAAPLAALVGEPHPLVIVTSDNADTTTGIGTAPSGGTAAATATATDSDRTR